MKTRLDERFFESTRGRIVTLLRGSAKTVNALSEELELTDNAVRAHLLSLERDGLVRQSGVQRGTRKPHFSYVLTAEADQLFPKAYDALLNQLVSVLKGRFAPEALKELLREVGRALAAAYPAGRKKSLESRAQNALDILAALGGAARLEKENSKLVISSDLCPLAAAVSQHPEVCQLAEALVTEIVGAPVKERCDRETSPRCRFEINQPDNAGREQ
jgi:predicted ArsR family transcriptional regulator